jgi:hypothetical protein
MNARNKVAWKEAKQITDTVARQEIMDGIKATGFQPGSLPYTTGRIAFEALKSHKMGIDIDDVFVDKCEKIIIASGAEYSFHACSKIFRGPWPAAQDVISKSAQWSHAYNAHILKGNGKIGEAQIAKNAIYSVLHALLTIRGRWPPG